MILQDKGIIEVDTEHLSNMSVSELKEVQKDCFKIVRTASKIIKEKMENEDWSDN